jgi:hypothetical protein
MAAMADWTQGLGRASSAPVVRGMGTGLSVPSAQLLGRGAQGRSFAGEWQGVAASALGTDALLGEKTGRGGGTRVSGPAQPSPGHGERAARRGAVERGKGGRAHLGEAQRGAAHVSSATRTATAAALRAGRGSNGGDGEVEGEKLGEGRGLRPILEASWAVAPLESRTGISRKKHSGVLASWRVGLPEQRRRARNHLHARCTVTRAVVGALALARSWATRPPRRARWAGRASAGWAGQAVGLGVGPRFAWAQEGGKGAGPSGRKEREEGTRVGRPNGPGKGRGLISFLFFFLFFYYFSLTSCANH